MTTINDTLHALVAEMAEDDVPDPLAQSCTLALVWADLARLADEPLPPDVAALLDGPRPSARHLLADSNRRRIRSVWQRQARSGVAWHPADSEED